MTNETLPGHDEPRYAQALRDRSRWTACNGGYPKAAIYTVKAIYGGVSIRDEHFRTVFHQPFLKPFTGRVLLVHPDGLEREVDAAVVLATLVPFIPRGERC